MSVVVTDGIGASLHWFRKGLRLHDNPALLESLKSTTMYPVYIIQPELDKRDIGINRYTHMLETLTDLDQNLRAIGTRLFVIKHDDPMEALRNAIVNWDIKLLTFEKDTDPIAKAMDAKVLAIAAEYHVKIVSHCSHTLFDPLAYHTASKRLGISYTTYGGFCKLFLKMGPARSPLPAPTELDMPKVTLYSL
jgi:cryptochrome